MVSCEHGGNQIPPNYRALFRGQEELLASHLGYDRGALPLARQLAADLAAPLEFAETTRLLVDLNRGRKSPCLFSEPTRDMTVAEQNQLLLLHYLPYRAAMTGRVSKLIADGAQVLHLSVHSFTPCFQGKVRHAKLGLLYDPVRNEEKRFSQAWKRLLKQYSPDLRVRCNYPYRGTADGLTRSLRQKFGQSDYLGIELEVNQALLDGEEFPPSLQRCLHETLCELLPSD